MDASSSYWGETEEGGGFVRIHTKFKRATQFSYALFNSYIKYYKQAK